MKRFLFILMAFMAFMVMPIAASPPGSETPNMLPTAISADSFKAIAVQAIEPTGITRANYFLQAITALPARTRIFVSLIITLSGVMLVGLMSGFVYNTMNKPSEYLRRQKAHMIRYARDQPTSIC